VKGSEAGLLRVRVPDLVERDLQDDDGAWEQMLLFSFSFLALVRLEEKWIEDDRRWACRLIKSSHDGPFRKQSATVKIYNRKLNAQAKDLNQKQLSAVLSINNRSSIKRKYTLPCKIIYRERVNISFSVRLGAETSSSPT